MAGQGRYTLVRKIADGGTAEVFLANMEGSAGFKRMVVLKRVRPALWADENFRKGIVDEAHIAMGLHHGNIVQVLDLGTSGQKYFLAFELVDGWTLSQINKRAKAAALPMPLAIGLHVMGEVCRALSYAHQKVENGVPLGIVHRDVSPQNVLISEQGEVKLTDFGIAKARTRTTTSEIGSVKGKPAFMSPEQAAGHALDARSDLFPIGTMIYQLATGELPFSAPSALEEMARVVAGKFTPPEKLRADLPKDLVQLIGKALEREPKKRFQTAEELLLAIEKVQRAAFGPAGTTELKAWLGALAKKDGEQPLSRQTDAAAPPAAPRDVATTEPIELSDDDIQIITSPSNDQIPISSAVVLPAPRAKRWPITVTALVALAVGTLWIPLRKQLAAEAVAPPPAPAAVAPQPPTLVISDQQKIAEEDPPAVDVSDAASVDAPDAAVLADATPELTPPPMPAVDPALTPPPMPPPEPVAAAVVKSATGPETADERVSVQIESDPDGAEVRIDRRVFGVTPIPLRLKVGLAFELILSKPGFREQKVLHFVTKRTHQKLKVTLVKN